MSNQQLVQTAETSTVSLIWHDITNAGFFNFKGNYRPKDACCDFFTYTITLRDSERSHTVTAVDIAEDMPPELSVTIHAINSLLFATPVTE